MVCQNATKMRTWKEQAKIARPHFLTQQRSQFPSKATYKMTGKVATDLVETYLLLHNGVESSVDVPGHAFCITTYV